MKRILYIYSILFFSLCLLYAQSAVAQNYTANEIGTIEGGGATLENGSKIIPLPGVFGGKSKLITGSEIWITPGFPYPVSYFQPAFGANLDASKGFYSTYVQLNWEIISSSSRISQFRIFRKVLGSTEDSVQIASVAADARSFQDQLVDKGVLYQYTVFARGISDEAAIPFVNKVDGVGFAIATGTITGQVTYEGGNAVKGVSVVAETEGDLGGKSLYLNGVDAYMSISPKAQDNEFELRDGFTLQIWNRFNGTANSVLFSKGDQYELSYDPTAKELSFKIGTTTHTLPYEAKTDTFYHVAVSYSPASGLALYAIDNGDSTYTSSLSAGSVSQPLADGNNIFIGKSFTYSGYYQGYINEVRLWNKALTKEEIEGNYLIYASGREDGILGYWRVDAGVGSGFYDSSRKGVTFNQRHGEHRNGVWTKDVTPLPSQLGYKGITDEDGNYAIVGFPYEASGTLYKFTPIFGVHEFDPAQKIFFVGDGNSILNGVDFKDISAFKVTGSVRYSNTADFGVEDVVILIDGNPVVSSGSLVQTDINGQFEVDVPIGKHTLRLSKQGHVFEQDGFRLNPQPIDNDPQLFDYQEPVSGLVFWDTTLVKVSGRVVGGPVEAAKPLGFGLSTDNIGDATLTFTTQKGRDLTSNTRSSQSYNLKEETGIASMEVNTKVTYDLGNPKDVKINPNTETGEYIAYLLPEKYVIKSAVAGSYTFDASNFTILDLLNTQKNDSVYADTVGTVIDGAYFGYPAADNPVFNPADTVGHDNLIRAQISTAPDTSLLVTVDTFFYEKRQDFIYRTPPIIIITNSEGGNMFGEKEFLYIDPYTDEETVVDIISGNVYNFSHPIFLQMQTYVLKAKLSEEYVNNDSGSPIVDLAPVIDGKIEIRNNLANSIGIEVIPLDKNGEATYRFAGGVPVVTQSSNTDDSYTAPINITAIDGNGQRTIWRESNPLRGILLGSKLQGNNFTTYGPTLTTAILRDPPGSNSYTYLEKGQSFVTGRSFQTNFSLETEASMTFTKGTKITTVTGTPAAGVINNVESSNSLTVGASYELNINGEEEVIETVTTTTAWSTSDSDELKFVGSQGDIIVGTSYNIVYGVTEDIGLMPSSKCSFPGMGCQQSSNNFSIGKNKGLAMAPKVNTTFMYTVHQIENNVIPSLIELRNSFIETGIANPLDEVATDKVRYISFLPGNDERFGSSNRDSTVWGENEVEKQGDAWAEKGPSYRMVAPAFMNNGVTDTVHYFNQQIRDWKDALAVNEKAKLEAELLKNISLDAGVVYEESQTTEVEVTTTKDFDWFVAGNVATEIGVSIGIVGGDFNASVTSGAGETNVDIDGETNSTTYGYVIADGSGAPTSGQSVSDFYSIDVKKPKDGHSPVFSTIGGVSSCPYEGQDTTKYYEPGAHILNAATVPAEAPTLEIVNPVITGIPANREATFILNLGNESTVDGDNLYILVVNSNTNPDGAAFTVDGIPVTEDGIAIPIPAGQTIQKILKMRIGREDVLAYEDIVIDFKSICDPFIDSPKKLSAFFIPGCSEVVLDVPTDNWVLNANVSPKDTLATKISQYNLAFDNFQKIQFQYKAAGSALWITDKEFYNQNTVSQADYDAITGNKAWIQDVQNTGAINYQFPMSSLPDRNYVIRARTLCETTPGSFAETPTEELTGTKDTKRPKIFGSPQPANGILTANDEISVRFDEPIEAGLLTPFNFSVQGVLNGFELKHKVSLDFDGVNDYVSIPAGLNLESKNFTISAWVKRKNFGQKQTIFSKGNLANDLIEFGFTASDKIYVQIGSQIFESNTPNTENDWMHLSFTYNKENRQLFGYKNSPTGNAAIFENVAITDVFTGEGPVNIGRSVLNQNDYFQGNVHELRVWSKARQLGDIVSQMSNALSGGEIGLIGYWQFNEAFGNTGQDKARFRTAQVFSDWEVLPKGSAVAFDGTDDYVELPTANSVIASDETDFSIEMWFKGASQSNATLFSSGKGNGDQTDLLNEGSWSIGFNGAGQLELNAAGESIVLDADNQLYLDDNWHHLAVSVNRLGNISILVDGDLQKSVTSEGYPPLFGLNMWIGARGFKTTSIITSQDQFFNGEIDEVRIWQYARKQAQIMLTRNAKLEGDETGLMAYYPFEKFIESNGVQVKVNSLNDQTAGQETLLATFNGGADYTSETPNIIDARPITKVDFDFAVNVDEIIITPSSDQNAAIEKSILEISVERVEDKFENRIASPVVWTAFVDKNQIIWGEDEISYEKLINEALDFEVEIVNRGGTQEIFTIDNLPAWLTASPKTGEIDPSSTRKITFTVNPGLNVGSYEEDIFLTSDFGFNEKLNLKVRVELPKPENWTIDPADFQFSMNVISQLKINGRISNDNLDEVAVFVGDENRGIARLEYLPDYDNYQAFLTVYSNVESGDSLQFKVWDDSEGLVYADVTPKLTFSTDTSYGRPSAPLLLETTNFVEQRVEMPAGWKWVSFNLKSDSLRNLNYIFRNLNSQNGDQIKSFKGLTSNYNSPDGWLVKSGDILEINKSYQMKNAQSGIIIYEGMVANPIIESISIKEGWNQIGFVPNQNLDLNEALSSFNATDGDIIKSQYLLAVYDASFGWIGNLRSLVPGQGYMLKAQNAGTLTYPETSITNGRRAEAKENDLTHFDLGDFHLNPHQFSLQMNLVGEIINLPYQDDSEETRLLALDGDKIVGIAKAQFNPLTENYDYFMTIYGDEISKELTFTLTNSKGETISPVAETIGFADNAILGETGEPLSLTLTQEVIIENGLDIYPNPFSTETNLRFNLMENAEVNLEIIDALGRAIRQITQSDLKAGRHKFVWNGKDATGIEVPSGVYFVKARFGSQMIVKRIVLK